MTTHSDAMLVVEKGIPDDVSVIPLDNLECFLGKSSSSDVIIDNPYVSRRHAQISRDKDGYLIRDLGSKNGTFVNGFQLKGRDHRLNNGDRIEFGVDQVVLKFQQWGTTVTLPPINQSTGDGLLVDKHTRDVWIDGQKVDPPFSRKEFDILHLLFERRGEACSKNDIAIGGWPERARGDVGDQDIQQYIRHLRLRIEPDPSHPQYIVTVSGFGYRLVSL